MLRQIISVLLIAAALTFASYEVQDRQIELQQQAAQLHRERQQLARQNGELAGQLADVQKQLRDLRASHELYILVTEDIDKRLVRAEGKGVGQ